MCTNMCEKNYGWLYFISDSMYTAYKSFGIFKRIRLLETQAKMRAHPATYTAAAMWLSRSAPMSPTKILKIKQAPPNAIETQYGH